MSGLWTFNNGQIGQVKNPNHTHRPSKVLVYLPTGEVISSYSSLEQILTSLGWERYDSGDSDQLQYHKCSSGDLISLPKEFSKFKSVCMYDIIIKNPDSFRVSVSTE